MRTAITLMVIAMILEKIRILKSQFLRRANDHNPRKSNDKSTILTNFFFSGT